MLFNKTLLESSGVVRGTKECCLSGFYLGFGLLPEFVDNLKNADYSKLFYKKNVGNDNCFQHC